MTPTSIIGCIYKGFTGLKCKITRFHAGVHGYNPLYSYPPPTFVMILTLILIALPSR